MRKIGYAVAAGLAVHFGANALRMRRATKRMAAVFDAEVQRLTSDLRDVTTPEDINFRR